MPGNKRMRTDGFGTNPDDHPAVVEFQDSISPGIAVGHRISVTLVRHICLTRDLAMLFPPEEVGRDGRETVQVLLVQSIERDLVGSAVVSCVHPVAPLPELPVHVVKRREGSSKQEVPFNVADGILDLPLGLGTVGSAEPGDESVMAEEVLELRVPPMVGGAESPLEDHGFDIVVEDLFGVAAEVLERIEMAFDEGIDIGSKGKLHVPHPGISQDHAEAVDLSRVPVCLNPVALAPVYLCLNTGFRLEPENSLHILSWPDRADIVLDNRVLPVKPHIPDLPVDPGGTERVVGNPVPDILGVVVKFARSPGSLLWHRRNLGSEVTPYGSPVEPSFPGNLTDGQSLVV